MPDNKIRVAFIRQKYRPDGGAERILARIISALSSAGNMDMTVLSRKWEGEQVEGIKWKQLNPRYLTRTGRERSFAHIVQRHLAVHDYDIVQSHERIPGTQIYRAGDGVHKIWLKHKARVSSIFSTLFSRLHPFHQYQLHAEKRMYQSAALKAVICNSNMVKQEILNNFEISPDKLHVIYNAINPDVFNPDAKAFRDEIRKSLDIPANAFVLAFVGSGFERKGLQAALETVKRCQQECHLLVIGKDKHTAKYEKWVKLNKLSRFVHFLGVQNKTVPFYGASDALFLPTLYDPFPNVATEALACGLPVITSHQSGASDVVENEKNGFCFDALDIKGYADAIDHMIQSPDLCETMQANAVETSKQFTLDKMKDAYLKLYHKCLAK